MRHLLRWHRSLYHTLTNHDPQQQPQVEADPGSQAKIFAEAPIGARVNPLSMTIDDSAKVDEELRRAMIETAAYFLAALRQFETAHELDDWCAAEN